MVEAAGMQLAMRPYAGDDDFWRVRAFLRGLLLRSDLRPTTWHVARWDYWRWHGLLNVEPQPIERVVLLWEAADGSIAGLVHPDGRGEGFIHVDPRHRSDALDRAMLAAAEERLPSPENGELSISVPASDARWTALLEGAGYRPTNEVEHVRAARLQPDAEPMPAPQGYRIRSLGGDEDFPSRGEISLRVFHPVPDGSTAMTVRQYANIQRAPLYRRDLDLVAEAADGQLAGFVTVWFDDVTRTALIEPMGVDDPHRRRGLGQALLREGMRRAARMGATVAFVGSYSAPAHALYESVGLVTAERLVAWRR
jgi:mycothiol synthase